METLKFIIGFLVDPLILILSAPLAILLVTLFYGFSIDIKNNSSVKKFILINAIISLITTLIFLWWIGGFCGIDGGARCNPQTIWRVDLITFTCLFVVGIILMFLGVLLKKLFLLVFKSNKKI